MMRLVIQLVLLPLPWAVRRPLLNLMRGWKLDPGCVIGKSIVVADRVELAEGAMIGHLTMIKGLSCLKLSDSARLGNLNWVTAVPQGNDVHFSHLADRDPSLVIEQHAAVTHRHLIDCTAGVRIGAFSTIAGWHSQIISHSFDFRSARQDARPVVVGERCFVGSRSILLKGCHLPDRSILGAASVYDAQDQAPLGLYRGNPARREAELPPDLAYFTRTSGFIA